jgi:hypothetical protein
MTITITLIIIAAISYLYNRGRKELNIVSEEEYKQWLKQWEEEERDD